MPRLDVEPQISAESASQPQGASLLGPALVALGSSLWGLETYWRQRLTQTFDADVLVFHEHWLGLLLTLPFLLLQRKALRTVSGKAWLSILASGVLGSALGTVCFTQALTLMNSSVANLLLNVQPVISVLVAWFWLQERPRGAFYPWAVVAVMSGAALAWDPTGLAHPTVHVTGLFFIAATAACWGASTTFGRAAMLEIDYRAGTALRYLIGTFATGTMLLVRGAPSGRLKVAALQNPAVLKDMAGLLVVAAITPTFIYFAGLARTRASVATFAEMAQTFASLIITWGIMGDALTPLQLGAGLVLLTSVVFIHRSVEGGESGDLQPFPANGE